MFKNNAQISDFYLIVYKLPISQITTDKLFFRYSQFGLELQLVIGRVIFHKKSPLKSGGHLRL